MGQLKESILIKGILPISDVFFHTSIGSWYSRIGKMLSWSPEQVKEWQSEKMRQLISDAYTYSPYYHQLFDSLSLRPEDFQTFDDLKRIPPLTKEIIRDHYDEILLQRKQGIYYQHRSTGGSTGNPTRYVKDKSSWSFINAFNILMWKQTGYRYGDKYLALGSSSIFPDDKKSIKYGLYYRIKGKVPFNAMNMSPEVMEECVKKIKKHNIHFIYGYASSIFLLAKYVEENHLGNQFKIKACFPTSEILTDVYRKTIERAFNCVVSDMYGAHDGGISAHCIKEGYRVGYNCFVQIEGGGESGVALLTDVLSTSFPIIRYRLGDELTIGNGYNEFYNGQVLDSVIGRTSDVIRLENGRVLTGPGFTVLFGVVPIKGYRISKTAPMQMTIDIVPEDSYGEKDENLIINTMHKHAGDECDIVIHYSDRIQTRDNGKNLYFMK